MKTTNAGESVPGHGSLGHNQPFMIAVLFYIIFIILLLYLNQTHEQPFIKVSGPEEATTWWTQNSKLITQPHNS